MSGTALSAYLARSADLLSAMAGDDALAAGMTAATEAVATALAAGRALLVCGNGGSASDAEHIAGELVGRFLKERRAYNVVALSANPAVLTALGNDYGFDSVYARQVEAHGAPGGVLLAISTSGNSANIVAAAEKARAVGMTVVGLTGAGGGALAPLCDILLAVPARETPLVQQGHLCLYHHLCGMVETRLCDG
ncbi:SIS domain-containing protein [Aquibium sp. A9E412]|uniref:D-sedoheptulose-7-phosphate isomerase n=1 Tax=Aquibium sp. A9E412 TaxID=2976767 RepID=UPI0025B0E8DE|nr:SIS domain-containing protein [Aquibium sp. A9E412]MDN2565458.1 SIS domain-containing protein [Aquibium sp. A9E412]